MTKPFDVDEIAKKQQIIDGSKRFLRMLGDVVELGKALEPIVSLERAANEAQARLDEIRGSEETLKAELDLKKEEIRKAHEDLSGILSTKQSEVTRLDTEITEKRAELEKLIQSRSEWLASVGIRT
jgi:chromosome segregation ATPase